MTEIPKPTETGSAGTQEAEVASVVPIETESPIEGLPIARTVEGLASTHARSMGGEVAANLIAGSFTQLSHNLHETRQELKSTCEKLENTQEELSEYKIKTAVLRERVGAYSTGRHLKNLSITAGTVLIAIAIEFYRNNFDKFAYIVGGLGALLIFLGWFSKEGRGEK